MTTMEMHRLPQLSSVIREQFNATALSLRTYGLIAGVLATLATFLAFADYFRTGVGVEFAPNLSMIPAIAGGLLPIIMWQRERHFDNGFLWTLPVDRSRHAFAKLFAGWLCLIIPVIAFVLWLLILALITKGNISSDEMVKLLPPGTDLQNAVDPSVVRTVQWIPQPVLWLVPLTAATGTYALSSAIMLGLRYPFRWIIGAVAGGFLIAAVGQRIESDAFWVRLSSIIQPLMYGRYGVDALLTARSESLHTQVLLTTGKTLTVWAGLPVISDWILATLLWTGLGIAGLLAALFRHRERR